MSKKGFTLIELLVVIAIIGLLSSLAVVNLQSARGKARDAKRINDVKQLALLIEIAAVGNATGSYQGVLPAGCDGSPDVEKATGCGIFENVDWSFFVDPLAGGAGTACVDGAVSPCDYSMTVDNTAVDNYEICFFMEQGVGGVLQGLNHVSKGGFISIGCSN